MNRSDVVLVYQNIKDMKIYCNVCNDYRGDVHGTCPFIFKTICASHSDAERFNNNIHRILILKGNCNINKGKSGCRGDCNFCVLVKRGLVVR